MFSGQNADLANRMFRFYVALKVKFACSSNQEQIQ